MGWQLAAALIATQVASTAISYMGSQQQSKRLKAAAAWDRYQLDLQKKQELIRANQDATELLSYQRAAAGAGGGTIGTGSSLLIHDEAMEDLNENLFWLEKGYTTNLQKLNMQEAGALAEESFKRKASIAQGATNIATTSYKTDWSKSLFD